MANIRTPPSNQESPGLFYMRLDLALFETKVLDGFRCKPRRPDGLEGWRARRDYGAPRFWHSYLVYRVRHETNRKIGYYVSSS